MREKSAMQGAMGRMLILHTLGATIEQAAAMVARISPEIARDTLVSKFRRSGLGEKARSSRKIARHRLRRRDLESILDEYPDGGSLNVDIVQGKAAIRSVYA
ncbi:MAG: hypothetical protein ACKVQU_29530 [Burkholderiales bacterium]